MEIFDSPEVRERKNNFKEFLDILGFPVGVAVFNAVFFKAAMAAAGSYGKSNIPMFSFGSNGTQIGLGMFVMIFLVYYWSRPIRRYVKTADESLKPAIRHRLRNIYRDSLFLILLVMGWTILEGLLLKHISAPEWGAVAVGFLAQAAYVIVALDHVLFKQKKLLSALYSEEELLQPRGGFSIPVSWKLAIVLAGFGLVPLLVVYGAIYMQAPWDKCGSALSGMIALSSIALLYSLNSIYSGLQRPADALIAKMRGVASGDYTKSRIYFSDEIAKLKAGYNSMVDGLKEREARLEELAVKTGRLESELAVAKATAELAAGVAHDIRSPLAALGSAAKNLELPEEQRKVLGDTVARLNGIADGLLERYRAPAAPGAGAVRDLGELSAQVVAEKKLQHRQEEAVKIDLSAEPGVRVTAAPAEIQRALSNLITNAVEAFDGGGRVEVKVYSAGGRAVLEVSDNGRGIPAALLPRLGTKGETHGKKGGNGLGLYQARAAAEAACGALKIESSEGRGTIVSLSLPLAKTGAPAGLVVLLDDDLLVHMNWRLAAKAAGAKLKTYRKWEDLKADAAGLPKDTAIYVDHELGDGLRGREIAVKLKEAGFTNLSMATGHGPEKFSDLPWLKVAGKEPPWA